SGYGGCEKASDSYAPDLDYQGDLRAVARSFGAIEGGLKQGAERSVAEGLRGQGSMPNFGDCAVGSGRPKATLLSVQGRFIDGSTDSQQRNPIGTEPKVRLEKQCEWKRGGEVLGSKIMAAFRNSGQGRRKEATSHSFLFDHFASRHPVQATLRLAPLGLDRHPSRCREPTLRGRNGWSCPGGSPLQLSSLHRPTFSLKTRQNQKRGRRSWPADTVCPCLLSPCVRGAAAGAANVD